ncbi:hypothetical protein OC698_02520, partial ['Gossypium sp.' phytoplasma]|nr:hypothetical protein ['Gossypium sp.' phytoplasma]
VVKHEFDTNDCHYLLLCGNTKSQSQLAEQYCEKWKSWMRQCYIKYGNYYSEGEIRDKIGRSSRALYDENGKSHWYSYKENPWYMKDEWMIDDQPCSQVYCQFLDTTRPPLKPPELT